MKLCLDAGNSRLKWGLYEGTRWQTQGVCAYPQLEAFAPPRPSSMIACNVAGPVVATAIEALAARLVVPLRWFRGDTVVPGLLNGYASPARLGADRWAALAGARRLHVGAAVVVMAGTATTVDALDAEGHFLGGLILPGLELMRTALARHTADLPEAQGLRRDFPDNTDDAIVSGCLEATLGAIERMAQRLKSRPASDRRESSWDVDFCCLLSGGAAPALLPHLSGRVRHVENLVLEGLAASAVQNDLL